jgi:hypothetical protein
MMLVCLREVAPLFDTTHKEWVVELHGHEYTARSLSVLRQLLPYDVSILNYHPKGLQQKLPQLPAGVNPPARVVLSKRYGVGTTHQSRIKAARKLKLIKPPPPPPPVVKIEHPIEQPKLLKPPKIKKIKLTPRQPPEPKPPRQIERTPTIKWTEQDIDTLVHYVERGLTSYQIAALMPPRTRNSIIGACHRRKLQLFGGIRIKLERERKRRLIMLARQAA